MSQDIISFHIYNSFSSLPDFLINSLSAEAQKSLFLDRWWFELLANHTIEAPSELSIYVIQKSPDNHMIVVGEELCRKKVFRARKFHSLTNFYTMIYSPVKSLYCNEEKLLAAFAEGLRLSRPKFDSITFEYIDISAPVFENIKAAFGRKGFVVKPYFQSGSWFETTEGISFDQYLKSRPSIIRKTHVRSRRNLEKSGRLKFKLYKNVESLPLGLNHYKHVYERSWKTQENYPGFIEELLNKSCACGLLRLGILYWDDAPVAAQIWFVENKKATIYKVAYDEAIKRSSMGSVLSLYMFEYILQKEKAEEINFGLGDDEYKKAWLGARRELWGIKIYNIYTVGGFFGAARQILPEKLSAFLKGIWAFMVVQRNKTLKEVHLKGRPRCEQIRDVALDEI